MKSAFLILVILLLPVLSKAQDSILIKRIDSISQYNYDHADTILYYLTSNDFFNTGGSTMIRLYKYKDTINRIVCVSRHRSGEYAIEYYLYNELLVFIFETTSYVREKAPVWAAKNFMQIHSSEHRYYLWDKKLVHSYGTGTDPKLSIPIHSKQLTEACTRIISWCKQS